MAPLTGKGKFVGKSQKKVRDYSTSNVSRLHPAQTKLIELTKPLPKSSMISDPNATLLLSNMIKFARAKRCIDIGVFTGYSSLSWALSVPEDGKVVACDVSMEFAEVGVPVWKEAGVDGKIDLKIAPAVETLQAMVDDGESGTYDFVFIDADKESYDQYYEFALKLLRPQGIIAIDNTFWHGRVLDLENMTDGTPVIRNLNLKIRSDARVTAMMVDISDGVYVCLKN